MLKNKTTVSVPVRHKGDTTSLSIPKSVFDRLETKLELDESEYTAQMWLASKGVEALSKGADCPSAYARELALLEIIPHTYTNGYKLDLDYSRLVVVASLDDKKKALKVNLFSALYYALLTKFGSVDAFVEEFKDDSDKLARQNTGKKDFSARYRALLLDSVLPVKLCM